TSTNGGRPAAGSDNGGSRCIKDAGDLVNSTVISTDVHGVSVIVDPGGRSAVVRAVGSIGVGDSDHAGSVPDARRSGLTGAASVLRATVAASWIHGVRGPRNHV